MFVCYINFFCFSVRHQKPVPYPVGTFPMLSLKEDFIREMHKHVSLESPAILSPVSISSCTHMDN